MSGFETRWLDLREPADRDARDPGLRQSAIDYLTAFDGAAQLVDLGCGTGSTFRALLPNARHWQWRFVDNDPALLADAKARYADEARIDCVEADLAALPANIYKDARLVTASALFDLVSKDFVERLAGQLAQAGTGLYAALNYDGHCVWDRSHEADSVVVAAFNAHQHRDKGFGLALGPDSGPCLRRAFEAAGLVVAMAPSPWRLTAGQTQLQTELIEGMADAVAQTGHVEASRLENWRRTRLEVVAQTACQIGHWDILALPLQLTP
jgi:SAM-dependent methyltransferase